MSMRKLSAGHARRACRAAWQERAARIMIFSRLRVSQWPERFFDAIRIDDAAFVRPDQGPTPPAPRLH
jgi:hypothetical protein